MFVDVPAPPWIMSTRKCSWCRPARISRAARTIDVGDLLRRAARARAFASAAASFTAASASMSDGNSRSGDAGDREVLERAQRLHAVQRLVGHLALAEQVVLDATCARRRSRACVRGRRASRRRPRAAARSRARRGRRAPRRACGVSLDHLLRPARASSDEHVGVGERARAGAVRRVVEQQSFADGLARRRAWRGGSAGRSSCFSIATAPLTTIARSCRSAPSAKRQLVARRTRPA